jgi:triacylglycerol esterase/lipase EstA (alpha/beta hydrolase family)
MFKKQDLILIKLNFTAMKKSVIFLFFVALCFSFSNGFASMRSGFDNYAIEAVDNVVPGVDVQKVWSLKNNDSENPVTVTKRNMKGGVAYLVSSKHFEVCYACTSKGFGIKNPKRSWCQVPAEINAAVLNSDALLNQKVITPAEVDDETALGLIASYLPDLINYEYLYLLN